MKFKKIALISFILIILLSLSCFFLIKSNKSYTTKNTTSKSTNIKVSSNTAVKIVKEKLHLSKNDVVNLGATYYVYGRTKTTSTTLHKNNKEYYIVQVIWNGEEGGDFLYCVESKTGDIYKYYPGEDLLTK